MQELESFRQWMSEQPLAKTHEEQTYTIPLKFHLIRYSDGTGGLDSGKVSTILDTLNHYYENANIQFALCGQVNFIDNDAYVSFEPGMDELALTTANDVPRVINIYFADSVSIDSNLVCGFSYLPGGPLRSFITNSCAINGNTVVHEIGHVFSLIHTHGASNTELTNELADGSNCLSAGDYICDTPADPNLDGKISGVGCNYIGIEVDANGESFDPMLDNIMSYTDIDYCNPDTLTPGQYEQFRASLFYYGLVNLACTSEDDDIDETKITNVYPNPFDDHLTIEFQLKKKSIISLAIFDLLGQRLMELLFEEMEAGKAKLYVPMGSKWLSTNAVYIIGMEINYQKKHSSFLLLKGQ